jgi:hypothetical protein
MARPTPSSIIPYRRTERRRLAMQDTVDTEASRCVEVSVATAARTVALPECWAEAWRRRLVNCTLVCSDSALALLVREAAIMLRIGWRQGPLSEIAIATVAST